MKMVDSFRGIVGITQGKLTAAEYWELVKVEINALYLFSFQLTADKEKAGRCLDQAMDESADGVDDFLDWAHTRGRDAVLGHAIRIMKPSRETAQERVDLPGRPQHPTGHRTFGLIATLPTFERFVFVLTRIDGLSDANCAALLDTTSWEVIIARELADHILAENEGRGLRH